MGGKIRKSSRKSAWFMSAELSCSVKSSSLSNLSMGATHASTPFFALLAFLSGVSITFSFWEIPLSGINLRVEDILVFFTAIAAVGLLACDSAKVTSSFLAVISFISVAIVYGLTLRYFSSVEGVEFSQYSLLRVCGILLYCVAFGVVLRKYVFVLLKGIVLGGAMTVLILLLLGISTLAESGLSGAYDLKDAASSLSELHVNTFGAIAMLTSFSAYLLWRRTGRRVFLGVMIVAMMVPLLYLIRRDIAGILAGVSYLLFMSSMSGRKRFSILFGLTVVCAVSVALMGQVLIDAFAVDFETGKGMAKREVLYAAAIQAILNQPLGYGWGSEKSIFELWYGLSHVAHNAYLSMAIELGVIFPITLIAFVFWVFFSERDVGVKFFIVVFMVESLFGNGLFFYKVQWVFLFIVLSLRTYPIGSGARLWGGSAGR